MPFTYDPNLRGSGYRDTATGRAISNASVTAQIDVMISASSDVTLTLSEMVDSGGISAGSWNDAMRQEIKDNYIDQYLVGIGGRENMNQEHWGSVGGMIADQYRYLDKFYAQVAAGDLSLGQINARARMYMNSSREAYERAHGRAALNRGFTEQMWINSASAATCDDCKTLQGLGWISIDQAFVSPSTGAETLPGMGDTICLTNCQCFVDYKGKRDAEIPWEPEMSPADALMWAEDSAIHQMVYHGTSEDAYNRIAKEGFADETITTSSGQAGMLGRGFYFSPERAIAANYGTVMLDVQLNVSNVLEGDAFMAMANEYSFMELLATDPMNGHVEMARIIQEAGYDAVSFVGEICVFDPENIVVTNTGATHD